MICHPEIKWAQREDEVYLTIELAGTKDVKVNLAPEGVFSFSATAGQHAYDLKLDLADKVNGIKINIGERSIFCLLKKAEPRWWNKLLTGDAKTPPYVKVDWDKWVDEDDEHRPVNPIFDTLDKFCEQQFGKAISTTEYNGVQQANRFSSYA
ncbi:HSP20-like chaperone [Artemisia annua]|uniref:Co-chaperone protein p23 n=1 Tax=Artemisia annua TaxID=35608 RepID=A0A2U1QJF4_ARTAN|nr:HSP20-like chaperone [Artemisia annua]